MTNANDPAGPQHDGPGLLPADAEQRLKDDAGAALEAAKSEAAGIKAEVETQAGVIAEEARERLGEVAQKAKSMAAEQKDVVSSQLGDVAQAVDKVAGELEASDSATAGYARSVADAVNQFSDTVKNKNVDELLAMAEDFGRRQPAAFMGVAALAGFAASRFLLASAHRNGRGATTALNQYGGTGVGDGGISGNYQRSGRAPATSTRDTMGGTV